jgi:hypothetical protein
MNIPRKTELLENLGMKRIFVVGSSSEVKFLQWDDHWGTSSNDIAYLATLTSTSGSSINYKLFQGPPSVILTTWTKDLGDSVSARPQFS